MWKGIKKWGHLCNYDVPFFIMMKEKMTAAIAAIEEELEKATAEEEELMEHLPATETEYYAAVGHTGGLEKALEIIKEVIK